MGKTWQTIAAAGFAGTLAFHLGAGEVATIKAGPPFAYNRALRKAKFVRPTATPFPAANQFSIDRARLGEALFFDPRLSGSRTISCATCHNPGFCWTDSLAKAIGFGARPLSRKTPTILNSAWADSLYWDGRAETLEEQALGPMAAPAEMNQPLDQIVAVITSIPDYRTLFARAYPGETVTPRVVARAIATFERSIVSGKAPFDEWIAGRESAISEEAKRGFDLFNTKAACAKCHSEWNFTDNGFHDIGLAGNDIGRAAVLPLPSMQHAFKTPTLRNIDRRRPYMHDGSEETLESVIELYDQGGKQHRPSLSPEIVPLHLSSQDKSALIAFLRTLTSVDPRIEYPDLPR